MNKTERIFEIEQLISARCLVSSAQGPAQFRRGWHPARKIVPADASPLMGLACIGALPWLHELHKSIAIIRGVRREERDYRRPAVNPIGRSCA
ncbi:MAG: hypothetical protein A3G24_02275 [Betaproteobacteria bacterium RIFCSPLOWO2_12_FULL_62_13]|nr:MAG: hypothetical protein A3G24_02275 [Betaproteobacteria bacterium RIFCSPLOWO2_12_FULL_62_13]